LDNSTKTSFVFQTLPNSTPHWYNKPTLCGWLAHYTAPARARFDPPNRKSNRFQPLQQ